MESNQRRRLIRYLLAGSTFLVPGVALPMSARPLNPSIRGLRGEAWVNGKPVTAATIVEPGDSVETGDGSHMVFVVGKDAHLMRSNTQVELKQENGIVELMRVLSGAILSVYGEGRKRVETPEVSLGIRGTATYIESEPNRTYLCTCYGTVRMQAVDNPNVAETVTTTHHDAPRFILRRDSGTEIRKAPVFNHTDAELIMLEATVGREPPFPFNPFESEY